MEVRKEEEGRKEDKRIKVKGEGRNLKERRKLKKGR